MLRELSTFLVLFVLIAFAEGQGRSPQRTSDPSANRDSCEISRCKKYCEFGFRVENGCEVCACKSDPSSPDPADCPAYEPCTNKCEHGFRPDERGCPTCRCKIVCPPNCLMACRYGFVQDENGCNTCACLSTPSSKSHNRTHSGHGHKDHHHGSRTGHRGDHEKHRPTHGPSRRHHDRNAHHNHKPGRHHGGSEVRCKPKRCPNRCVHGYAKDSFGCRTCGCHQDSQPDATTPPSADPCANRVMCTIYCEFGYQKGSDGCDTCRCNAAPRS